MLCIFVPPQHPCPKTIFLWPLTTVSSPGINHAPLPAGSLGFDVSAAMQQWTYQQGYPVVTVSVDDRRRVWLHQAPFGLQGVSACDSTAAWWIPIRWVGLGACSLMAKNEPAWRASPACSLPPCFSPLASCLPCPLLQLRYQRQAAAAALDGAQGLPEQQAAADAQVSGGAPGCCSPQRCRTLDPAPIVVCLCSMVFSPAVDPLHRDLLRLLLPAGRAAMPG